MIKQFWKFCGPHGRLCLNFDAHTTRPGSPSPRKRKPRHRAIKGRAQDHSTLWRAQDLSSGWSHLHFSAGGVCLVGSPLRVLISQGHRLDLSPPTVGSPELEMTPAPHLPVQRKPVEDAPDTELHWLCPCRVALTQAGGPGKLVLGCECVLATLAGHSRASGIRGRWSRPRLALGDRQ